MASRFQIQTGTQIVTDSKMSEFAALEEIHPLDHAELAKFREDADAIFERRNRHLGFAQFVKVAITGRKVNWDAPFDRIRVRVTFVNEDGEDDAVGGWAMVSTLGEVA